MERETGFEPATSTLARSHSTTELFPLSKRQAKIPTEAGFVKLSGEDARVRGTRPRESPVVAALIERARSPIVQTEAA